MLILFWGHPAHAQIACSSDAQPVPTGLFERFINADCDACWRDANTPTAPTGALTLDWVVPGAQGDDAPLSAAATRDALARLAELNQSHPKTQGYTAVATAGLSGATLRVAHGPAVSGYLGASISLTLQAGASFVGPLQAWLLMLETLPAGFEGSPVSRNLVRNALMPSWNIPLKLQNKEHLVFNEIRPMNIPRGAHTERLGVAGWVQDANGKVLMSALSACPLEDK